MNLLSILYIVEKILGIDVSIESFRPWNLIDVGIIILFMFFFTEPFFGIVDTVVKTSGAEGLNKLVMEGFKFSFVWMSIHLILLSLFGGIKNPILKFKETIFVGLLLGLILTLSLNVFLDLLSNFSINGSSFIYFVGFYPALFAILFRFSLSQELKS